MIIVGLKTVRGSLSSLGSIAFFLPTFGYYAVFLCVVLDRWFPASQLDYFLLGFLQLFNDVRKSVINVFKVQ